MVNFELLPKRVLKIEQYSIPIFSGRDNDMGAQCISARGDCPNMEVVHLPHAAHFDHGVGDLFGIEMRRDTLHENIYRLGK